MPRNPALPITGELDFSYLLGLMRPLHDVDEYSWLPELFAIIGHKRLIDLCRYCGGESITIPTLDQLNLSIEALQIFYDCFIVNRKSFDEIENSDAKVLANKILDIYNARNSQEIFE